MIAMQEVDMFDELNSMLEVWTAVWRLCRARLRVIAPMPSLKCTENTQKGDEISS